MFLIKEWLKQLRRQLGENLNRNFYTKCKFLDNFLLNIMYIINVISFAVGIIGLLYAIYENHKRKKIEDLNRTEAWFLYHQSCEVLSKILSLNAEVEKSDFNNAKIFRVLGEATIASEEMLKDSIRLIQRTEIIFNKKIIDKWFEEKRIPNETHLPVFKRLIKS